MPNENNNFYLKNDLYKMIVDSNFCSQKLYENINQLKQIVTVLLHYKYMLNYLHKNLSSDALNLTLKNAAPEFKVDLQVCFGQYNLLVEKCIFVDFIRKKEEYYESNFESYCSFKRVQSTNLDNDGTALEPHHIESNLIETFITEDQNDLIGLSQHQLNDGTFTGNNESSRGNVSFTSGSNNPATSMVDNANHLIEYNFGQLQTEECSTADENVNLLDLLHKNSAIETEEQSSLKDFTDVHHASTSGLKTSIVCTDNSKCAQEIDDESQKKDITTAELGSTDESTAESVMHVENDLLQVEYWCSYEGCRFKSKSLTQVKAHEERRHVKHIVKCSQDGCANFFDNKDALNSHLSDIHSGPMFKCALHICSKEFQSE